MSITIPTWVFWALGIAGGLAVLALAAIGAAFIYAFWGWKGPKR